MFKYPWKTPFSQSRRHSALPVISNTMYYVSHNIYTTTQTKVWHTLGLYSIGSIDFLPPCIVFISLYNFARTASQFLLNISEQLDLCLVLEMDLIRSKTSYFMEKILVNLATLWNEPNQTK